MSQFGGKPLATVIRVRAPGGNPATDLAKIQAAIHAAAAARGGLVRLKRGQYLVNESIAWPNSLIGLDRAGAGQFSASFFNLGSSATGAHVHPKANAVDPAHANGFTDCEFSGSRWDGSGDGGIAAVP